MNASATVSATTVVAATTLFAVFYVLENTSADLGDAYYGTISDKTLGDVKFSRQGASRSLYYVDPETQQTVLLSDNFRITWDAEGNLTDCVGDDTGNIEEADAMFPGAVGGDATIGATPANFIPVVPAAECVTKAKKQLMEKGSSRPQMAQYVRHLEEHDTSSLNDIQTFHHNRSVSMAHIAMLAYDDLETNERSLHSFGSHCADIYGFQLDGQDTGAATGRYGVFKFHNSHNTGTYAPLFFTNSTSQGSKYRCIVNVRGTDETGDWGLDIRVSAYWFYNKSGSRCYMAHKGFCLYTSRLTFAWARKIWGDNSHTEVQSNTNAKKDWYGFVYDHSNGALFRDLVNKCTWTGVRTPDTYVGFFIVGHSLGAGSASLLGIYYYQKADAYCYAQPETQHECDLNYQEVTIPCHGWRFFHWQDPVTAGLFGKHMHTRYGQQRSTDSRQSCSRAAFSTATRQLVFDIRRFTVHKDEFHTRFTWTCFTYYNNSVPSWYRSSKNCRTMGDSNDKYEDKKTNLKSDASFSGFRSGHRHNWIWPLNVTWADAWPMAKRYNWINRAVGYSNQSGKNVCVEDRTGNGVCHYQYSSYSYTNDGGPAHGTKYISFMKQCWSAKSNSTNAGRAGFDASSFTRTLAGRLMGSKQWYPGGSYGGTSNTVNGKSWFVENHPKNVWGWLANGESKQERSSRIDHTNSTLYRDFCKFGKQPIVKSIFDASAQNAAAGLTWMSNWKEHAFPTLCGDCHSSFEIYALEIGMSSRNQFRLWTSEVSVRWNRYSLNSGNGHA